MKFAGSKKACIECSECRKQSPLFRVYLYNDEEGYKWDGKLPDGWRVYDEAELLEDGGIVGACPEHPYD